MSIARGGLVPPAEHENSLILWQMDATLEKHVLKEKLRLAMFLMWFSGESQDGQGAHSQA